VYSGIVFSLINATSAPLIYAQVPYATTAKINKSLRVFAILDPVAHIAVKNAPSKFGVGTVKRLAHSAIGALDRIHESRIYTHFRQLDGAAAVI
jgi:hypothetical protein